MPISEPTLDLPRAGLLPDGCNTGVVFRALLAANGAVLGGCLLAASGWQAGLASFLDAAMLLESSVLLSLLALCALRQRAAVLPAWGQRLLGAALPALVAALLAAFLQGGLDVFDPLTPLRPWSAGLAAAVGGALLQHYFELRSRAFSPAIAEARLQALQARIRPHFLFNSLNAVLALIRVEPKRAEATLEDLAELFRVFMRDARDLIPLADELRLCRQYLAIEQLRLGERLAVHWNLDGIDEASLQRAMLPALLLQPLLENAVHHGVEPSPGPAAVDIRIARSLDRIEISVSNPLPSAEGAGGNHMALANIRERLAVLHDVEAELRTERADGRFTVRLRFPYVKAPA